MKGGREGGREREEGKKKDKEGGREGERGGGFERKRGGRRTLLSSSHPHPT